MNEIISSYCVAISCIIVPIIPAFIFFKFFPKTNAYFEGKPTLFKYFKGSEIKVGGAFAAYLLAFFLSTNVFGNTFQIIDSRQTINQIKSELLNSGYINNEFAENEFSDDSIVELIRDISDPDLLEWWRIKAKLSLLTDRNDLLPKEQNRSLIENAEITLKPNLISINEGVVSFKIPRRRSRGNDKRSITEGWEIDGFLLDIPDFSRRFVEIDALGHLSTNQGNLSKRNCTDEAPTKITINEETKSITIGPCISLKDEKIAKEVLDIPEIIQ